MDTLGVIKVQSGSRVCFRASGTVGLDALRSGPKLYVRQGESFVKMQSVMQPNFSSRSQCQLRRSTDCLSQRGCRQATSIGAKIDMQCGIEQPCRGATNGGKPFRHIQGRSAKSMLSILSTTLPVSRRLLLNSSKAYESCGVECRQNVRCQAATTPRPAPNGLPPSGTTRATFQRLTTGLLAAAMALSALPGPSVASRYVLSPCIKWKGVTSEC